MSLTRRPSCHRSSCSYLLDLWGYDLDMRPKEVRDSPEGRLASAVYRQTSEYLKPFFRMLKNKVRLPACVGV